ncbi:MAG: NifB/NifX family molybdenum-iron cluster-binding protein [Deltaproteobacteria bacterium]|nr:NifB/NifX family molybdenum-iron cluster-binding protein [Deltaproteobacteria bacterium]
MKICIPVEKGTIEANRVCPHFGSTPFFALFDSETDSITIHPNSNDHSAHGQCNPAGTVMNLGAKALLIGGIGARALQKLNAAGIKVYRATGETLDDAISKIKSGTLPLFDPTSSCAGHDCH